MFANAIYDPLSRTTLSNGLQYANLLPNNLIPASRFNATALAMQALFPNPNPGNAIWCPTIPDQEAKGPIACYAPDPDRFFIFSDTRGLDLVEAEPK